MVDGDRYNVAAYGRAGMLVASIASPYVRGVLVQLCTVVITGAASYTHPIEQFPRACNYNHIVAYIMNHMCPPFDWT